MKGEIDAALETWLAGGGNRIGEIIIVKQGGGFVLRHHADENADGLRAFTRPQDAREIAQCDGAGEYRPLKSAPNLRRGWELRLPDIPALHAALDFFYPAMIGTWVAHRRGGVEPVNFRETAGRQSGMYAVVKKISNEQADMLAGDFCRTDGKCLKAILWQIDAATPLSTLPPEKFDPCVCGNALPLLCTEACNLFVAAARGVVKAERSGE